MACSIFIPKLPHISYNNARLVSRWRVSANNKITSNTSGTALSSWASSLVYWYGVVKLTGQHYFLVYLYVSAVFMMQVCCELDLSVT